MTGGGAAYVVNIPNPGKYGRIINQLNKPFGKPDPAPPGYNLCPKIDNGTLSVFEDNPKTISKGGAAPTVTSASATVTGTGKPPAVVTTTTTSASAAAGTETTVAPISSASASASGTFITAPSDGLVSTATASATGGAESGSRGGGKCDDANATETGAGAGEKTTIEVTKTMTVKVTVTANVPSGASASAGSGSGSGGDEGGSGAKKKQCEKDQVAVCFGDDYFGVCDNGWAVPQKVSEGTRCENGSLVHSAVRREGEKRAEGYAVGEGHARRHLKRRSGRTL